jgi:hypothetical protein
MSDYIYNGGELYHYGVKGMRWGHRRAQKYESKARTARESAKEWKEIGKNKTDRLLAKGKTNKAAKVAKKYDSLARQDRSDAKRYDEKAKREQTMNKFRDSRRDVSASRSTGAKLATNILAGPFANRTYNSVIAAGGSKVGAIGVTAAATLVGGPVGHLAVSALYTSSAGDKKTAKNYR